jgi:hypothetical protein
MVASGSPARRLFYPAALFNVVVAVPFIVDPVGTGTALGMSPIPTDLVFVRLTFGAVMMFGLMYFHAGWNPVRYRANVGYGIVGKVATVTCVLGYWLAGSINSVLPAIASFDILWAVLFIAYLRRTSANGSPS